MRHQVFRKFDSLPTRYRTLLEPGNGRSFYHSLPWYQSLAEAALGPRDRLAIIGIEDDEGTPLCLFPTTMRTAGRGPLSLSGTTTLEGFTNVYTVKFGPVFSPVQCDIRKTIDYLVGAWLDLQKTCDEINIRFLNHDRPDFDAFVGALKEQRFVVQEYFQYGCYVQSVGPCSSQEFIGHLGSNVRKTLARRVRKVERSGRVRYRMFLGQDDLDQAIDDYLKIYKSSWKGEEAIPSFISTLIRAAAATDCLRLGIVYLDGTPAATQLSFVSGRHGSMFKTAYDEAFRNWGLGGVAIYKLMEYLLDVDHVRTVDFGIGDEAYKSDWLSQREESWGIVAFNPRTLKGLINGAALLGKQELKRLPIPFAGGRLAG